jgi:hypothetical protein
MKRNATSKQCAALCDAVFVVDAGEINDTAVVGANEIVDDDDCGEQLNDETVNPFRDFQASPAPYI